MTQKDNVKQLIGKSLNAYNNKVLQQIDRIEKKNEQQNHKISMLTNELDNDYLTKSEEGSVISLDHSKEGMVYIDGLEGNTLVNYCTDGSKELTLNGDIDLEGTFVTTTEGVDNGLVDVYCEGNTLVGEFLRIPTPNLQGNEFDDFTIVDKNDYWECRGIANKDNITMSVNAWSCELGLKALKEGVEYTVIVYDCPVNSMMKNYLIRDNNIGENFNTVIGTNKWKIIAKSDGLIYGFYSYSNNVNLGEECIINFPKKVLLLEGDWTNKEIPPYFEGMKSVGQDDENGHKIEILSRNDKLIINKDKLLNEGIFYGTKGWSAVRLVTKAKRVKIVVTNKDGLARQTKLSVKNDIESEVRARKLFGINESFNKVEIDYELLDTNILSFCSYGENDFNGDFFDFYDIEVFSYDNIEDVTPTTRYNKKEILLNEPLRKANDNVKDRFVKINGKLYIERNCKQLTITGNEPNVVWRSDGILGNVYRFWSNNFPNCITLNADGCVFMGSYEGVYQANAINIQISTSKIAEDNVELFVEYLKQNPLTLVIKRDKPIYEPLETNPELLVYNDTTHISNNSTIPCNMKIKNSGYNTIIKPSTLYTIALDINKSGTIGMNLGGTKGTTTNNVLTLTTPATLTDDSLRLHGKGIKGSKVRLLEGDKTNWIPSFFEGMKSSFEDKLQDDVTYKMEILSNNKNILNLNKHDGVTTYTHHGVTFTYNDKTQEFTVNGTATQDLGYQPLLCSKDRFLTFEQGKQYTLSTTTPIPFFVQISEKNVISALTLHPNTMFRNVFDRQNTNYCSTKMNYFMIWGINAGDTFNNLKFKLQIEEGSVKTEYIPNNYNKMKFSSIEPLRSVGNTKDKFVFKDGKLIIQRNIGKHFITKDSVLSYGRANSSVTRVNFNAPNFDTNDVGKIKVLANKYPSGENGKLHGSYVNNVIGITGDKYMRIMLTNLELGISSTTTPTTEHINAWLDRIGGFTVVYQLAEPTYEEIPFELQKIILEGYENGTLFFDTNIPPTSTITYAGETPIVKSVRLNKTEVSNNTNDINDNIIPYLMDMDYRVVCLQLESNVEGISMAKLFGGAYEMLKRDILSKRLTKEEYGYRLADYFNAGKLTEEQVRELEDLR